MTIIIAKDPHRNDKKNIVYFTISVNVYWPLSINPIPRAKIIQKHIVVLYPISNPQLFHDQAREQKEKLEIAIELIKINIIRPQVNEFLGLELSHITL